MRIPLAVTAAVVAVLCIAVLSVAATARRTVLETDYYQRVLDSQRTYDRLYDEVLVDPAAAPLTRDLLAGLPVPHDALLANLKVVLPPTTLRSWSTSRSMPRCVMCAVTRQSSRSAST
jgi:hypothetical protein